MQFENLGCLYGFAVAIGLLLSVAWVACYILSWVWAWTWAWIDDSKSPRNNPLLSRTMKLMGWKEGDWLYGYLKGGNGSDGESAFFYPLLALLTAPCLGLTILVFYPLAIGIAGAFGLAHITRFARRHKKLFDKHIKDPDAHK